MDVALHRSEADIEADLEYYFSDRRDKHNQIRPSDDIRSLTPDSELLSADPGRDTVGNLFFPFSPRSLERVFIGISFPLYATNFGSAFLRYLLEIIRPDGAIILPVYPEVRALEKGMWCRTALENTFRSRALFTGISNIWAENDGVMSMRVGRRWPPIIPSIARWLFQHEIRRVLASTFQDGDGTGRAQWMQETQRFWNIAQRQACVEQIIRDHFGRKRAIRLGVVGDNAGLLAMECLFSPYIRVPYATAHGSRESDQELRAIYLACSTGTHGTLEYSKEPDEELDVLVFCSPAPDDSLRSKLRSGGWIIETPEAADSHSLDEEVDSEQLEFYSSRVAQRLQEGVTIHHYATHIEEEIATEAVNRQGVFRIIATR